MSHPDDLTLQSHYDGELDDAQSAEVSAHVSGCAVCASKVESLRAVSLASARWLDATPALPDDFADALLARAEPAKAETVASSPPAPTTAERPVARVIPLRRWAWSAVAVAAAGLFALSVTLPRRPGGKPEPPGLLNDLGGAKVTRVDIPGAQSFTVMQLPGLRPDTVTAVVWIQDTEEGGGSP